VVGFQKPPPLDISCTATNCDNDLRCFKQLKKMTPDQRGKCRACGADLVDWKWLHRRDEADAAHTFKALQHELIQHHFFNRPVDDGAMRHAQRKGRDALRQAARDRLTKYLAVAEPFRDGRQTPLTGNVIYYAQHATATCCRTCLEYWHDIPKGRRLSPREFDYCATLVDLFFEHKLPDLAEEPISVPLRRRGLQPEQEELNPL
jgi:hypothetical protein